MEEANMAMIRQGHPTKTSPRALKVPVVEHHSEFIAAAQADQFLHCETLSQKRQAIQFKAERFPSLRQREKHERLSSPNQMSSTVSRPQNPT
ncbi:hypothetical protein FOTG_18656 [Fusarium oxysporum f. sp. vasinfectum 25433]|uniref:Uncharacterized protein n=1 Tax=Fusarium oxysporum f. sp. vasinfectum 25433 TaxID=1089449 RepID=X0KHB7_FUSOX|nr:hypothetical protein FOTG_18656 [Fusarium oxysporum f. sp. vasinfectum 25433]